MVDDSLDALPEQTSKILEESNKITQQTSVVKEKKETKK
jgi:hypothetical protein